MWVSSHEHQPQFLIEVLNQLLYSKIMKQTLLAIFIAIIIEKKNSKVFLILCYRYYCIFCQYIIYMLELLFIRNIICYIIFTAICVCTLQNSTFTFLFY
jgi:hypothetical protein